jgi:hypothetical protein
MLGFAPRKLTAATTAALAPGRYTDVLRITIAGKTLTLGGLSIIVAPANPLGS